MNYVPHLDGVRALAALMVVANHAWVPGFPGGFIAVDVFFVLSGYLITKVLQDDADLKSFAKRRIRRLVPPLFLMVFVYVVTFGWFIPAYPHFIDGLLAFFYLSDFSAAYSRFPNYLRHTWSLSVEAHFYMVWPLVFVFLRPGIRWLFFAYVLLTAWRWIQNDWVVTYYRFDTHATGLLLGCVIAELKAVRTFPAWPGLVVLALACLLFMLKMPWVQQWGLIVVEVAAAIVILGRAPEWLTHAWLGYLGKLSYGIYLWHYPFVRLVRDAGMGWQICLAVSLLTGIGFAALSYHFWEVRFRKK